LTFDLRGHNDVSVTTEQFRIGELARRAGATPRAVRYYEEVGLLPERGRPRGRHRMYDVEDVQRLKELLHVKETLGLSLGELRTWSDAEAARAGLRERWHSGEDVDPGSRIAIAREALELIETQIALVASRRSALEELEDELTAKRRRVREILLELGEPGA
jgi:DNA-binding transcriptional MerR regulator